MGGNWRAGAAQARFGVGGQLIDPGEIPHVKYKPEGLWPASTKLRSVGDDVHATGAAIESRWRGGLPHHYQAPEAAQLVAGMGRVVTLADAARDDLFGVALALSTFASDIAPLVKQLESLRSQAWAFRGWALDHLQMHAGHTWREEIYPPWGRTGADVNRSLCNQVGDALDGILRAEAECVSAIDGCIDTVALPPASQMPHVPVVNTGAGGERTDASGNTYDWRGVALTSGWNLPWGGYQSFPHRPLTGVTADLAHALGKLWHNPLVRFVRGQASSALGNFVTGPISLAAGMAGLHLTRATDPMHRGDLRIAFSAHKAGQTWGGLWRMSKAFNVLGYTSPGAARQSMGTLKALGTNFIDLDDWKKDPWYAAGKVDGNIASLLVPGPIKGAGLGHVMEESAALGGRVAEHGIVVGGTEVARGGGLLAKAVGLGLKAPKFASDGGWVFPDVRLGVHGLKTALPHLTRHFADHFADREVPRGASPAHLLSHDLETSARPDWDRGVSRANQHLVNQLDQEMRRYTDAEHALRVQKLNGDLDAHRFERDLKALQADHDRRMADLRAEAQHRTAAAVHGHVKGDPDHDVAAIRKMLVEPDPAKRVADLRDYVHGLTSAERRELALTHPMANRLVNQLLGEAGPADRDMLGTIRHYVDGMDPHDRAAFLRDHPALRDALDHLPKPPPAEAEAESAFRAAWERIPEKAREQALDILLWRSGPLNMAGQLPGEYFWPGSPAERHSYDEAVRYLQHHPEMVMAEYLRAHALSLPTPRTGG